MPLIFFNQKVYEGPTGLNYSRVEKGIGSAAKLTMNNSSKSIGYNEYAAGIGSLAIFWTLRLSGILFIGGETDVRKKV